MATTAGAHTVKVVFVHGFLGQPDDWAHVASLLQVINAEIKIELIDLFNDPELGPNQSLEQWADQFINRYKSHEPIIAVGYSLGGRLLAQVVKKRPTMFEKVFFISSNPFTLTETEKIERDKFNTHWADKFKTHEWPALMSQWAGLRVFKGSKHTPFRLEDDFERDKLSMALINWSPTLQQLTVEELSDIKGVQFFWAAGDYDVKYKDLIEGWSQKFPEHKFYYISQSGHRVHFDAPEKLTNLLTKDLFKKA